MAQNQKFEYFEKYDMNACFISSNEDADQAAELYLNRYPERRQPEKRIFQKIKNNLCQYGSFNKPRSRTYNKDNEESEVNVLALVQTAPETSCRKIGEEAGVPKTKVQKILKKHKFKPYKYKLVHHLHPGDAERRLEFCNWFINMKAEDIDFEKRIIWSDEAHFTSSGILNRHNTRFWSQENNHVIFPRERQGRFGFNVSCFIFNRKIVYQIYEGNLNSIGYVRILEDALGILDDVPLAQLNRIYFQQDGAPAHNARISQNWLNDHFPGRWIGTHGPVRWPPRSPDLSVLDFFLWGYLENKVYVRRYENLEQLRMATENAFAELQRQSFTIENALKRIFKVCHTCRTHNGLQFEQYL